VPPNKQACLNANAHAMRLRDKPVSELTIADFKVNPLHNQGYDYNFNEAARLNDPKDLRGCMDPKCCLPTLLALANQTELNASRPIYPHSQEYAGLTDEEYTVKQHMGRSWNLERVRTMTSEEFQEKLLDARVHLLSREYGLHKKVSHRPQSPPGLWDTEMETTQEMLEKQVAEAKYNLEKVKERYAEAVRGGRWIFRDERP